jgi:hypothetical protein
MATQRFKPEVEEIDLNNVDFEIYEAHYEDIFHNGFDYDIDDGQPSWEQEWEDFGESSYMDDIEYL